jgi:hypothetical protein
MDLLISLLVVCLVLGLVAWIVVKLGVPDPWRSIILAVLVVVFLVRLLGLLGRGGFPVWRSP